MVLFQVLDTTSLLILEVDDYAAGMWLNDDNGGMLFSLRPGNSHFEITLICFAEQNEPRWAGLIYLKTTCDRLTTSSRLPNLHPPSHQKRLRLQPWWAATLQWLGTWIKLSIIMATITTETSPRRVSGEGGSRVICDILGVTAVIFRS